MLKPPHLARIKNLFHQTLAQAKSLYHILRGPFPEDITPDHILSLLEYEPSGRDLERRIESGIRQEFQGTTRKNLEQALRQKAQDYQTELGKDTVVSIGFRDLHDPHFSFSINTDHIGWAASIIKIPVMIEVYKKAQQGALRLEDKLEVTHRHPLEPFDAVTLMNPGTQVPIQKLLQYMIVDSDNEATNMLIERVGLDSINQTLQELGATRTMLGHLLTYYVPRNHSPFNPDGSNVTTAQDMAHLLHLIYTQRIVHPKACKDMMHLLETPSTNCLGLFLPYGTRVGNKIGSIHDLINGDDLHDVGVINRDYALSIMINRITQQPLAHPQQCARALANPHLRFQLYQELQQLHHLFSRHHRQGNSPFEFRIQITPRLAFPDYGPAMFIGKISKAVYDIYYEGTR